jgi:hypothetical protein
MNNHKLYLYRPGGSASDFLGELLVDNLNVNIKLHEMSTITFTIPEKINNIPNTRLDEVLDGYIVELWYGQVDGVYNPPSEKDFEKIRFILHKTPLDFNDFKRIYSYEGYSIESNLELRQITNWAGVFVPDFYRSITYNNSTPNQYTEVAATGQTIPNHPYIITAKSPDTGSYIKIAPTTATATPLDIYVYEVRENTDPADIRYNEIAYVRYNSAGVTPYNESGFKQGYYFLDLDANQQYVEYIYIYVPDNYSEFDEQPGAAYKKLRFKVYDNPISRHYAIGVNRNSENPFTDYYIDLAQDVEDGAPAQYGNYTFTTKPIRSKNGLKLEHVLLGNIQTRDISNNIDNNTLIDDGLLYNTDFTIGTIDAIVAAKYRSNLEFNNTTVYQAIRDIAESFDAIAVFDTIAKTVSFYPENATTWPNNGLILKYGTYLKNISKDIDASKIVTAAKAVGKDNSGIELITPDGNDYWEDFSYYLDEFYIDKDKSLTELYDEGFDFTLENNPSTGGYYLGISYPDSDDTSLFQSRWMDAAEAKKLAKWQFNRDFLHNVLLGEFLPSDVDGSIGVDLTPMNRFYELYNLRSEAINDYVQSDRVLSERKAEYYRYKNLYDFYEKTVNTQVAQTGSANPTDQQRYIYYKNLWEGAQAAVEAQEASIENKRLEIFTSTIADSIGDKLNEVRSILNKSTVFSVDLNKLKSFIKESVVTDSKLDNDFDLLEAVVTHVNENKIPRITLNVGIVNILAAQESYDDWNKLRVGDLVNVYFPEFNIDEEIQIREVAIDFEQHTASLVIASVRTYNKSRGNYVSKSIKQLLRTNKNNLNNIEDFSRVTNSESEQTYATLNGGTINTTSTVIAFGATDSSGEYGNTISGSGGSLLVVSSVDPLTETFNFSSNKSLFILDGAIQSFYDAETHITQVEVSGENGFVIRKITGSVEDEDLSVIEQVYIDTDGNASFAGTLVAPSGNIGGFTISSNSLSAGATGENVGLTPDSGDSNISIYAGAAVTSPAVVPTDAQINAAPFTVSKTGAIKATSGTIAGLNIGKAYTSINDRTNLTGQKDAIFKRFDPEDPEANLPGVWGENQTAFYLDQDGRFSLSNELKWDPDTSTFFVNGEIQADIGNIGGWKVDDNTLTSVDNSNVLTPNIQLDRSGRILIAGSTFGGTDNEYITDARIIIDNTGITGNDGTNTTFRLTTGGVLTAARIILDSEDYSIRIGDLISDGIQNIAGNYGLSVQNSNAIQNPNNIPYQVTVSEEGFFITTVSATSGTDRALAVQYDYDRIWAKRLVISDLLPEDSTLQTEEQALLEASTLIGRLSSTEHGVRVVQEITETDKFNIIKMTTEGFAIYQNEETLSGLTNPTFQVEIDGSISATSLKISGTSELGGWTVADTYFESNNYEYTSGNFSDEGIKFNENGTIIAKQFAIDSLGNAYFSGALEAASGSFSGEITAESGEIGGFTIGETTLTAGATGEAIGISPSTGTNISFYAGAVVTSPALLPTTAEIDAAPFTVSKTGALKATDATIEGSIIATSGSIGGWNVDGNSLSSSDIKIVSGTNPYISIGQDIEGYQQSGTYIGDTFLGGTAVPTFSVGDVDIIEEEDFEGSYTQGDTAIGNWTSSLGVYLDYSTAPSNSFVIDDQNITTGAGQTWNLNNPTGHYFLLKGWDNTNSIAGLLEFTIPNTEEDYLLEFNAHVARIGGSPGNVALEVRDDSLSTLFMVITGFAFFNKYQVKIPARSTDKIVFRFTKSTSALGLIALDNIKLDKVSGISYDSNDGLKVNGGNIGGFDIGALKLTGGTSSLLKNYLGLSVGSGTSNNIAFWAGAEGNSAAQISNALFRVTQTGALTSTSGSIANWTIGANSLTGGNATLASSGNLTLGTSNDVVRLSADDTTYRIWAGNTTAASAKFSVTKAGVLNATDAIISGNITATTGNIGGFTVLSNSLSAGASGSSVGLSPDYGSSDVSIWAGATRAGATPTDAELLLAPFRVTRSGQLTALSGKIGDLDILSSPSIGLSSTLKTYTGRFSPNANNENFSGLIILNNRQGKFYDKVNSRASTGTVNEERYININTYDVSTPTSGYIPNIEIGTVNVSINATTSARTLKVNPVEITRTLGATTYTYGFPTNNGNFVVTQGSKVLLYAQALAGNGTATSTAFSKSGYTKLRFRKSVTGNPDYTGADFWLDTTNVNEMPSAPISGTVSLTRRYVWTNESGGIFSNILTITINAAGNITFSSDAGTSGSSYTWEVYGFTV